MSPRRPTDDDLEELKRKHRTFRGVERALAREGVVLGKSTIADRLAKLKVKRKGAPPPGKAPRRPAAARPPKAAPVASPAAASPATPPGAQPLADFMAPTGDEDVDTTRARLRRLRALINEHEAKAFSGDTPFATWAQACRLEADLTTRIASQVLPTTPRPEDDPANEEAADLVSRKLARLVSVAESLARCAGCGASPFASVEVSADG